VPELSLAGVAVVAAVAFLVPLLLGLFPGLRLPSVVGEIVVGIVLGSSALGWVHVDVPLEALSIALLYRNRVGTRRTVVSQPRTGGPWPTK
jgi:Kef-type K+ transport system membrane component KefB